MEHERRSYKLGAENKKLIVNIKLRHSDRFPNFDLKKLEKFNISASYSLLEDLHGRKLVKRGREVKLITLEDRRRWFCNCFNNRREPFPLKKSDAFYQLFKIISEARYTLIYLNIVRKTKNCRRVHF